MKLYQGDSVDGTGKPHTFIEVEENSYLEVNCPPLEGLDEEMKTRLRKRVQAIKCEEDMSGEMNMRMAHRFFASIYPVPNLKLIGNF